MKKFVCCTFALLLSWCLLLTACRDHPKKPGNSAANGDTTTVTQPDTLFDPTEGLTLIEEGNTSFTIVYDHTEYWSNSGLKNYVDNLQSVIRKKYNVEMDAQSTGGNLYDPQRYEILIGNTGYAESKTCRQALREGEWSVSVCGNKLVLVGTDLDTTKSALYWFVNTYLKNATAEKLIFSVDDAFHTQKNYDVDSILVLGTELKDYTIALPEVYSPVEYEIAGELRRILIEKYGYALEMTTGRAENAHEIRIGQASGLKDLSVSEYQIRVEEGNILFSAPSVAVYEYAVQALIDLLCADQNVELEACDIREDIAEQLLTDGVEKRAGEIRIIYHNVYGWTSEEPNIGIRAQIDALLYDAYAADVLCLQEMSASMRKLLIPKLTALGYSEVVVNSNGENNYTPVFYRTECVELVDCGWLLYDGLNDGNSKSVTWAHLKGKTTGKSFVACSTHFCWNDAAIRVSNANQLVSLLSDLSAKNLPIIFGGDLNTVLSSDPIRALQKAGYVHLWDTAENKDNISTHHAHPVYNRTLKCFTSYAVPYSDYKNSIDHALYTGNIIVSQFRVLHSSYALKTSDHCPLVVDFTFC